MKRFILLLSFVLSPYSIAAWNELECEGINGNKMVRLEIEQPFPYNTYFRKAALAVTEGGSQSTYEFSVTPRINPQFGRVNYWGSGLRIEVDIWPNQLPRWGQYYPSRLESSVIENWSLNRLNCTFPNAL